MIDSDSIFALLKKLNKYENPYILTCHFSYLF